MMMAVVDSFVLVLASLGIVMSQMPNEYQLQLLVNVLRGLGSFQSHDSTIPLCEKCCFFFFRRVQRNDLSSIRNFVKLHCTDD